MLPPKKAQFSLVEEIGHLQLVISFLGVGQNFFDLDHLLAFLINKFFDTIDS